MTCTIRAIPALYLNDDLPSEITSEDEAIDYVSAIAEDIKCIAWLSLSRRERVSFDRSGEVTGRHEIKSYGIDLPYMQLH